jgi:putative OPT family oligopeptide transporter
VLGIVMCLSNLYVFFKTGWSVGVTITAAILAFAVFRGAKAAGILKRPFGALENNVLTTVASGAGYMTGGGNMAAFGALLMVGAARPDPVAMIQWLAVVSALGVCVAIPIKRQLIDVEALPFPTGTATAETIRSLHADGVGAAASDGAAKSRALGVAALVAGVLTFLRDAKIDGWKFRVPGSIDLGFSIAGQKAAQWTLALKTELVLVGAGALMSFRTTWSLLLGGVLTYGFLAPKLLADGLIQGASYKAIVAWTVWPGASILVASGIVSFLLDWRSVARAFGGIAAAFRGRRDANEDPRECPAWWFPAGFLVLTPIIVWLMADLFHVPPLAGAVAAPLAVLMGFVAARVTGETDVTPTKALGPVTQLLYGVLVPGNLAGNIMSANVTGGVGLHAADLLTTLKTGKLLGGSPRAQFFAQLAGVAAGAAVIVPAFFLLIPDPSALGGDAWPAPACVVWAGVSKAFAGGLDALGPEARRAIAVGLLLGTALALAEKFAPKKLKPYLPSPSGLGIAMVVPGSNSVSMFLGGFFAEMLRRRRAAFAEKYVTPVASGFIAGESLTGVLIAILIVAGVLQK